MITTNYYPNLWAKKIVSWQQSHGRNNLPWQVSDPYKIWLSEIMLQQTQVSTVLSYYPVFLQRFPNLQTLAQATEQEVLKYWAGLGYYSRARNLHHTAQALFSNPPPYYPFTRESWEKYQGIGRSTAAAIVAFAFQQREAILDGNIKRVLTRVFAIDNDISEKKTEVLLWQIAEKLLPENKKDMSSYTQGMMDLGALICKRKTAQCEQCPVSSICQAYQQGNIANYPVKKQKLKKRKVELYWPILLTREHELYLTEKQDGIWEKLLTPPTFDNYLKMQDWLSLFRLKSENSTKNYSFNHQLTHLNLTIHCYEYNNAIIDSPLSIQSNIYPLKIAIKERIPKPLSYLLNYWYFSS